jgi:hypothetical protein
MTHITPASAPATGNPTMQRVSDLARSYASHMDGWRAEPDTSDEYRHEESAFLVHDGERVRLRVEAAWQESRLIIAPVFPYEPGVSGPRSDGIGVNPSRDPAAVAKDILRRAVPAVIEGTRQWEANIAAHEAWLAKMARLRADMAAEFPALSPWPGEEPRFGWSPPWGDDDYWTGGTVNLRTSYRVGPPGTLEANRYEGDIQLRGLPLDAVKRVLRALAQEDEQS